MLNDYKILPDNLGKTGFCTFSPIGGFSRPKTGSPLRKQDVVYGPVILPLVESTAPKPNLALRG
ncbi:hypothetical protein CWM47_21550 [Spirosoma pollinicola]|uniref:Uncharacterized protein n=1 Tax=Spirosoma pollinicola TaxID=2057025 RepID=A0A2K8Z2T3_9BACT|nr:hypothetical protein CWM47_21550 [Spirosoma pollinicola]